MKFVYSLSFLLNEIECKFETTKCCQIFFQDLKPLNSSKQMRFILKLQIFLSCHSSQTSKSFPHKFKIESKKWKKKKKLWKELFTIKKLTFCHVRSVPSIITTKLKVQIIVHIFHSLKHSISSNSNFKHYFSSK